LDLLFSKPRLVEGRSAIRNGKDAVTHAYDAVGEDVGPKAASVHQRPQHGPGRVALYNGARLAEPHATTAHLADFELVADQGVEVDSTGNYIAAVLATIEWRSE
jgi:hypothetical protein